MDETVFRASAQDIKAAESELDRLFEEMERSDARIRKHLEETERLRDETRRVLAGLTVG